MQICFRKLEYADLDKLIYSKVAFILYNEHGKNKGDGEAEVVTITEEGITFSQIPSINYSKAGKLLVLLPLHEEQYDGIWGKDNTIDNEWQHYNLNEGCHLFVRNNYRNLFLEEVVDRGYLADKESLCDKWREIVGSVLSKDFMLFGYEMKDGWNRKIGGVYVFDRPENNVICTFPCRSRYYKNMNETMQILTLKEQQLKKVKEIIYSSEGIFDIINVETPAILDGIENWFLFRNGGEVAELSTSNIYAYRENESVNAKKIISVFDKIAKVLVDAGVQEKYLYLFPEELQ